MLINIIYMVMLFMFGGVMWGICDNSTEIYEYTKNKIQTVNRLNVIRKQSGITLYSIIRLSIVSLYTICKVKIVMKIQTYMDGLSVVKVGKNMFEVSLFVNGKFIKMMMEIKMGPSDILFVMDENLVDVTERIVPYYNYKMVNITPDKLGFESLQVVTCNGETIDYKKNCKIV